MDMNLSMKIYEQEDLGVIIDIELKFNECSLFLYKHIDLIEKGQRRATKFLYKEKDDSYSNYSRK